MITIYWSHHKVAQLLKVDSTVRSRFLLNMRKVPVIDHDKERRLFKKMRKWAKEMGAPDSVLEDLEKIEGDRDLVHRILSGGWDKKFKHIITHVKPLCEAEHINKTVALYKAQIMSGKHEDKSDEDQLKSAAYVQAYLSTKEKQEKIKKMKKKLRAVELNVEGIMRTIEIDGCIYKQLTEDVTDLTKKIVLLDLKTKHMTKQVEQWNEITMNFKRLKLANIIPKSPIFTPEIEAMVKSWVEKQMDITKTSIISDVYETGGDADAMLDELINDLMMPKTQILSKHLITALVKIVLESRKTLIKAVEENVDDQAFIEYREGRGKHLKNFMEFHHKSDEEIQRLRKSIRQCELQLMALHTELTEELVNHVVSEDPKEDDLQQKRDLVENYLDHLIQKKRVSETKSFMKENIASLTEEAMARANRNDAFQTYSTYKEKADTLVCTLQDKLRSQGTRVKQLTQANFRTSLKACKQRDFVKEINFGNMKDMFIDELEQFLLAPLKIMTRSWESDEKMLSNEARMSLIRKSDVASGPDHMILKNILGLLFRKTELTNLCLPTKETKILSEVESYIKEMKVNMGEVIKAIEEKQEKARKQLTEADILQDKIEIVLNDWMELPFYDYIPDNVNIDGKDFTEWQNLD